MDFSCENNTVNTLKIIIRINGGLVIRNGMNKNIENIHNIKVIFFKIIFLSRQYNANNKNMGRKT
jgi:hypothetical protein